MGRVILSLTVVTKMSNLDYEGHCVSSGALYLLQMNQLKHTLLS